MCVIPNWYYILSQRKSKCSKLQNRLLELDGVNKYFISTSIENAVKNKICSPYNNEIGMK